MRKLLLFVLPLLVFLACGSDDDIHPADIAVGEWHITKYEIKPETDIELLYTRVVFAADMSFRLYAKETKWDDDDYVAYSGQYEIGDAYVRLEYDEDGRRQRLLAEIMSCTATSLVWHYKDSDQDIEVTLWLEKR